MPAHACQLRQFNKQYRVIQTLKHFSSKDEVFFLDASRYTRRHDVPSVTSPGNDAMSTRTAFCIRFGVGLVLAPVGIGVQAVEQNSHGQRLYIPVYSEVPYGDKGLNINLTATLSIRNTDSKTPVTIRSVDYLGAEGNLIRSYLKQPITLRPMASTDYVVKESDRSGGISASFLVEWESREAASPCLVEAVMVNSSYNHGIAFSSPARVLETKP